MKYSLWVQKILSKGASRERRAPSVNLGPPNISESKRARKVKVEIKNAIRHSNVLASGTKKIPLRGIQGGTGPPNVNLGPPKILETTRARMLKLNTQLDIVKYSL